MNEQTLEFSIKDQTINNRYQVKNELGQGGMGTVYLAHDLMLDRDVALKLMSEPHLGTEGRSRLLDEARTVAQLKHPNIVTVYDAGEVAKQPYVVMEYVQGETLDEHQLDGFEQIVAVAKQICTALQYAHDQGIIHRDLKPENVFIQPDGKVLLMDFGLAVSTSSRMTENGLIMGTVAYMSPEQAFGYEVSPQSDLYSLGVILYELTTKHLPFEAEDALAVITQHIHAPVVPPRAKNEAIPPQLNDLILALLNKDPSERPNSAQDVLTVLADPQFLAKDSASVEDLAVLDRIVRGRIVGRKKEFAEARMLWGKAASSQGQALLISGEPGIGKTRLMREIITHVEVSGGKAFVGECYEESNAPYSAFSQITHQALTRFGRDGLDLPDAVMDDLLKLTPEIRHQYPGVQANPSLDPESEQLRLFENMVAFCEIFSDGSPLLLVVDDAHWGDSGTLAMLHHLIRRTQKQPVMLLVTYREVELTESHPFNYMLLELNRQRQGTRLKLNRLDRQETRAMLQAIFAEQISDEFLEGIYRETDGNPFFIEEVCRALVESGALWFEDGEWHRPSMEELEIPQGVQVAVESRLAKLPEQHQEVLRMASILGREFHYDVLLAALDLDEDTVIEALDNAEEAQMIQEVDGKAEVVFMFVHALVPSAIYDSVRTLRRRKLHRKAAAAIEAIHPQDYESLAYHYGESGDSTQAVKFFTLAGERAAAAFANQDAERYFLSALDLVEDPRKEADFMLDLGIALSQQGKYQQALKYWHKAINLFQEMGESDKVAELYARSARTSWDEGDTKAGLEVARQGLAAAEGQTDGPGLARLLAETCRESYFNGLHDECEKYGLQALQMAERLNLPAIQADTLATLGMLQRESPGKNVEYLEQAVEISKANNLLRAAMRAHNNLNVIYMISLGDFPKGKYHIERAIELNQQVADPEYDLFLRANLIAHLIHEGRLKEAARQISDRKELRDSLPGYGFGSIALDTHNLFLITCQGHFAQALDLIQDSLDRHQQAGDLQRLEQLYSFLIWIGLFSVDLDLGESAAQKLIELGEKGMASKSEARSYLSLIYSRMGQVARAREFLNQARAKGEVTLSHYLDQVHILWAQAELQVAERNWQAAWQSFEDLVNFTGKKDFRWFSRWASVDWVEALLKRGEPEDILRARQMLEESLQDYRDMGADGFVEMVEKRLQGLDINE